MRLVAIARPKMYNVGIAFMPRTSSNVSGDSIAPLIGQTENGYLRIVDVMPWENVPTTGQPLQCRKGAKYEENSTTMVPCFSMKPEVESSFELGEQPEARLWLISEGQQNARLAASQTP